MGTTEERFDDPLWAYICPDPYKLGNLSCISKKKSFLYGNHKKIDLANFF